MTYSLVFSKQAETDLIEILQYTLDNFGERQYWIYRDLIKEAVDLITSDPTYIASRARNELAKGARSYHISRPGVKASHFLLYRINESEKQVELGRILHESVDTHRHLPSNFPR